MTLQDWTPLYSRLCAGLGRKETPAQMRAYFDALSSFPVSVVSEAVRGACSRTWPPTHPHAGDVREIAAGIFRGKRAPGAVCDVCHGDLFSIHFCAGVSAPDAQTKPLPVNRHEFCGREWVHADHDYAVRCYQCRPSTEAAS